VRYRRVRETRLSALHPQGERQLQLVVVTALAVVQAIEIAVGDRFSSKLQLVEHEVGAHTGAGFVIQLQGLLGKGRLVPLRDGRLAASRSRMQLWSVIRSWRALGRRCRLSLRHATRWTKAFAETLSFGHAWQGRGDEGTAAHAPHDDGAPGRNRL